MFATPQVAELTCLSVQPNGNIEITWTEVTNFGASFDSYEIFASTNTAGPFTSIQSVPDVTTTSYTTTGYDGNTGTVYFYVETNSAIETNSQSVTLNSIFLTLNNAGDGIANLSWNKMHTPDVYSPTTYSIYREYPTGTWISIGSTTYGNENFTHINSEICNNPEIVNYRVDVENPALCASQSNIKGDLFANDIVPINAEFTNVTVEHSSGSGDVLISWNPSPSLDVIGYIIYYNHPQTGWGELVTVFGINTTSYTHIGGGNDASAEYSISAMDFCNSYPSLTTGTISTVRVWASKYPIDPSIPDECKPHTLLEWNLNILPSGVSKYNVYCSDNGGNSYYFLAEVNSDISEYIDERSLDPTKTYFYYIDAVSNDGYTSSSNFITANPGTTLSIGYIYANHASITDYNKVELSFTVDTTSRMKEFQLLRSEYIDDAYSTIATFDNSEKYITYYDNIDIDNDIYHYKLTAVNICDDVPDTSNITTNIVNRAFSEGILQHRIEWSEYFEFPGNIKKYDIYQVIDNETPTLLTSVSSDIQSYHIDNMDINHYGLEGDFCYYVEAIEDSYHPMGMKDTSRSNISCVAEQHHLYLPTAFTPDGDGINDKFIPGIAYPSHNKFLFQVYNKWGEVIYESTSPLEGWDGTVNGTYAQPAVYAYLLRFFTAKNELVEKRSTFTLVR